MKYLFLILLFSINAYSQSLITKTEILSLIKETFFVGCINGFVVVKEQDMFSKPLGLSKEEIYSKLEVNCKIKSEQFTSKVKEDISQQ